MILIHVQDWAREEVMLTPEKPIVGRPMSEIYPDYDVTTTETDILLQELKALAPRNTKIKISFDQSPPTA